MDRFWSKVDKSGDCWEWTACRTRAGYGQFKSDGRLHRAHRLAWALTNGPIPEGKHVLHRCDNPGCVNPDHLFLGSHQDNMDDMSNKGRRKNPGRSRIVDPETESKIRSEFVPGAKRGPGALSVVAARYGIPPWMVRRIYNRKAVS